MLKKASLGVLFLSLFLWARAFCFECRVYNVGQANLVVIRHNNYSLVIDCGKKRDLLKKQENEKFLKSVTDFIANNYVSLAITHQHLDHYNFVKEIQANFQVVLIGGLSSGKEVLSFIPNAQFCEVWEGGAIQDKGGTPTGQLNANTLQGCLGRDVRVQLLLSDTWVGNHEHDQNLVLKVTYRGKSILFPGDASGKLLDKIITRDTFIYPSFTNRNDLIGINCMLLSHHGSNDSGELEWFRQVYQRNFLHPLVIVSSDPTGIDKLPWNMVKDLPTSGSAEPHQISVRGRSEGKPGEGRRESFLPPNQPYNTNKALFTTCDVGLYYAITIDENGRMTLTSNGETPSSFRKQWETRW